VSPGDYIKDIKVSSSLWMKECGKFPKFKNWQDGYGAFTYSMKEKDIIINYIINQKEHHKSVPQVGGIMMNISGCLLKMELNSMRNICCKIFKFNPCGVII